MGTMVNNQYAPQLPARTAESCSHVHKCDTTAAFTQPRAARPTDPRVPVLVHLYTVCTPVRTPVPNHVSHLSGTCPTQVLPRGVRTCMPCVSSANSARRALERRCRSGGRQSGSDVSADARRAPRLSGGARRSATRAASCPWRRVARPRARRAARPRRWW